MDFEKDMDAEMDRLSREALARLETITNEERRQLGYLLTVLADCFGEGAKGMAVLSFRRNNSVLGIMGVNTSDMDAAEILSESAEVMGLAVTRDAPAKEMFN
jgi:hypothetical protein